MTNANMPLKRFTHCGPHCAKASSTTSVSPDEWSCKAGFKRLNSRAISLKLYTSPLYEITYLPDCEWMGWLAFADKSIMLRRLLPKPTTSSSKYPPASGPRCTMLSVIRLKSSDENVFEAEKYPVIPHISVYC